MSKNRLLALSSIAVLLAGLSTASGAQSLMVTPSKFDFGWCPDNAKVSADFIVKNTGVDMIPITSVQPTCGCTASQFTPGSLAANAETKVGLTFNTRGYAGSPFHKTAKVKTDNVESEYTVELTGYVTDPNAKVVPEGTGIVAFEPGSGDKKKSIKIFNKGAESVRLEAVQKTADWAKAKLESDTIKPGESTALAVSIDGSADEARETSVTFAVDNGAAVSRLTVAIRTGAPPTPIRVIAPPTPAAPTPAPVKPAAVKPSGKKSKAH